MQTYQKYMDDRYKSDTQSIVQSLCFLFVHHQLLFFMHCSQPKLITVIGGPFPGVTNIMYELWYHRNSSQEQANNFLQQSAGHKQHQGHDLQSFPLSSNVHQRGMLLRLLNYTVYWKILMRKLQQMRRLPGRSSVYPISAFQYRMALITQ